MSVELGTVLSLTYGALGGLWVFSAAFKKDPNERNPAAGRRIAIVFVGGVFLVGYLVSLHLAGGGN